MIQTNAKPFAAGDILTSEFMEPINITQGQLADAMGVSRRLVNEICNNKRGITADTALILSVVFDTSVEFWLNLQRQTDLWDAYNDPERRQRIDKARKISVS